MSGQRPTTLFDLPAPPAAERRRGEQLEALIRKEIECSGGSVPFPRYMDLALYAPALGYYAADTRKFGAGGDFVTAPGISPLFSRCVATQTAQILAELGTGDVLEAGAGDGGMAADILAALEARDALPARYLILERSAALRSRQHATLAGRAPDLLERVRWLDGLPEPGFEGVVLANELLDALPVTRFRITARGVMEERVAVDGDRFAWKTGAFCDPALAARIEALVASLPESLAHGYVSEFGPQREAWVGSMGERVARGALLLFDYGYTRREYYHPDRCMGTLQCHYRHRAHPDPLILAGVQDISAHVDFTGIADASGMHVAGFTTQADFLLAAGLLDELTGSAPGTPEFVKLTGQVKRLTLPGEMGEAVKVMALTRGLDNPLCAFARRDHRARL